MRLFGGYESTPAWLGRRDEYYAVVLDFFDNEIEGRTGDERLSASIEFDEELESDGVRGRFGYLTGRWSGQTWEAEGVAHLNLCDRDVRSASDVESARTAWLESHASYEVDAV